MAASQGSRALGGAARWPNGDEHARYYINSDTQEGHHTFAISYERPIEIIGGGKVHVRIFDDNCRMIKNCSTGGAPCTDKARSIDIAGADPQPTGLQQPGSRVEQLIAGCDGSTFAARPRVGGEPPGNGTDQGNPIF